MHYFITCFWGSNLERIKLCQKFVDRHPYIYLLQNGNLIKHNLTTIFQLKEEEGYKIQYKMINEFIKNHEIDTITIIDSDLILPDNFRTEIIKSHVYTVPSFTTYRRNYQLMPDGKCYFETYSKIYNVNNKISLEGRTGYILSFNNKFLKVYNFPTNFLSGFDYFLVMALLGHCISGFEKYYKLVPKGVFINYANIDVIHIWHKRPRFISWNEIIDGL